MSLLTHLPSTLISNFHLSHDCKACVTASPGESITGLNMRTLATVTHIQLRINSLTPFEQELCFVSKKQETKNKEGIKLEYHTQGLHNQAYQACRAWENFQGSLQKARSWSTCRYCQWVRCVGNIPYRATRGLGGQCHASHNYKGHCKVKSRTKVLALC